MVKEDFSENFYLFLLDFVCFFCFAVLGLNAVLGLGGKEVGLQ
jgi:hypothetical protein